MNGVLVRSPYPNLRDAGRIWGEDQEPAISGYVYRQTDIAVPGIVLHLLPDGTCALPGVAPTGRPIGVYFRDRTEFAPYVDGQGNMSAQDISIISRGKVMMIAGGICTSGGAVHYSDDGTVFDAGTYTLPHAVFHCPDTRVTQTAFIVAVELHSPLAP